MSDLGKNLSPSNRGKKQKIRKSNKRKLSSTNWIKRQINDPYVIEANKLGYKSRACLLYTSPSPRDSGKSRMPSSA